MPLLSEQDLFKIVFGNSAQDCKFQSKNKVKLGKLGKRLQLNETGQFEKNTIFVKIIKIAQIPETKIPAQLL